MNNISLGCLHSSEITFQIKRSVPVKIITLNEKCNTNHCRTCTSRYSFFTMTVYIKQQQLLYVPELAKWLNFKHGPGCTRLVWEKALHLVEHWEDRHSQDLNSVPSCNRPSNTVSPSQLVYVTYWAHV